IQNQLWRRTDHPSRDSPPNVYLTRSKSFLDKKRKYLSNAAQRFVSFEGVEPPNQFGGGAYGSLRCCGVPFVRMEFTLGGKALAQKPSPSFTNSRLGLAHMRRFRADTQYATY